MVMGTPNHASSNMPTGCMPCNWPFAMASMTMPAMIRFTAPPMSDIFPPRIEIKLRPMNRDGATWRFKSRMTGIIIATIGVLLIKALPIATGGRILRFALVPVFGCPISRCESSEMAPVAYMPAATGKRAATVKTPVLLNPFTSACGDASFKVIMAVNVAMNTSQVGYLPQASTTNIRASRTRVNHA